jgi:hypothetical protein
MKNTRGATFESKGKYIYLVIKCKNMPKSDVYNVDCIEYMRGLPDKVFDLAVADPP